MLFVIRERNILERIHRTRVENAKKPSGFLQREWPRLCKLGCDLKLAGKARPTKPQLSAYKPRYNKHMPRS